MAKYGSKSKAVARVAASHPRAGASELQAILKRAGLSVSLPLIHAVLKHPGRNGNGRFRESVSNLAAVKACRDSLGGRETLLEALDALRLLGL